MNNTTMIENENDFYMESGLNCKFATKGKTMASNSRQRKKVRDFISRWEGKGSEKQDTQNFWIDLLQNVLDVNDATSFISFEKPVCTITQDKGSDFIDGYIPFTKVLIEQKSRDIDLSSKLRQSNGEMLTPYQQARKYASGLPTSEYPRWIVTCNFRRFEVYDMEHPSSPPQIINLEDLEKEYSRLSFLTDRMSVNVKKEEDISIKAGEIVGLLYEKILPQYINPQDSESLKSLNKLCVRLVFCLYAEDAGIFGKKNMFHDYMSQFTASDFREKLIGLFKVLDTKPEERGRMYLSEDLAAFPYVNGGLFSGDIEIPVMTEEIRSLILSKASDDFDWSEISPTIFGAVFESTLNPSTRREGGMHYTSIENIHRVINPLFLTGLNEELAKVKSTRQATTQKNMALQLHKKIANLKFLDPACGSGNFLTETYISLRRIENELIRILYRLGNQREMGDLANPVRVSINQFYGIEINDFACSVAQTALWIAEIQMLEETNKMIDLSLDPLPLKSNSNIREGNALRTNWDDVINAENLNYIMGNPPFTGARVKNESQKEDLKLVFGEHWKNVGNLDYVTGWYKKSAEMMDENPKIKAALVSTNSISQGEQPALIFKPLFEAGMHIDFAYRSFVWDSQARGKAHVHCVIIGFSKDKDECKPILYEGGTAKEVRNINGYLSDCGNIFVESRSNPIQNVPEIGIGNQIIDNGHYLFTDAEKEAFCQKESGAERYFKRWYGSDEFINRRPRWCLWLGEANPTELIRMAEVKKRIEAVREFRSGSKRVSTLKLASRPTHFQVENMPKGPYLLIPRVSSERRKYIPIGFMTSEDLSSDAVHILPDAGLYHFGILTSSVHNAWMRAIGGRLESRYRYSKDIVYNNFPWPDATETQKSKIEEAAKRILAAREKYKDASLSELYSNMLLFPELMDAHQANDLAVMEAYSFKKGLSEHEIVDLLLKMYSDFS